MGKTSTVFIVFAKIAFDALMNAGARNYHGVKWISFVGKRPGG
jgi:hypothetical protein